MPDRLPSLIVLAGFWVPPVLAGWAAARALRPRRNNGEASPYGLAIGFAAAYATAWFLFNLHRMPPYIPGALMDPTIATPEATRGLAAVAGALVLPGSVLAFVLAFRRRRRDLAGAPPRRAAA